MITAPPRNTLIGGTSFKKIQTQSGAHKVSISIKIPTVADSTVLDPIVIHIKLIAIIGRGKKADFSVERIVTVNNTQRRWRNDSVNKKP